MDIVLNTDITAAKRSGKDRIADSAVQPACAQACPTQAITFGDITDKNAMVTKLRANTRSYALLSELNTHPRTTYMARLRNPNPELVS